MIQLPQPKERTIYLATQVNQDSINKLTATIIDVDNNDRFLEKLYKLENLNYNPEPIKIYIDCYGGSVYQCYGLLSIMKSCKTKIETYVTGCAMSAGFMIAITGHERFGYKNSTWLYHQVSGGTNGKVKDMEESIDEVKRLQKMLEKHTIKNTNISKKLLKKIYKRKIDYFISAKKAIKLGIIDKIV